MYIDLLYMTLMLPALILSIFASLLIKYYSHKYFNRPASTNLNGRDIVAKVATKYDLNLDLRISSADLSDNYNPYDQTLTLSSKVANRPTISSVAITCHELGHVLQHHNGSILIHIRRILVPAVNIGTNLGYILIVIGLILSVFNLAVIGLIFFSLSTVFAFLTLPIEIDASRRGLNLIKEMELLRPVEISGAKKVLISAALTYVAGLISSLSNLLYFFLQVKSIKDK